MSATLTIRLDNELATRHERAAERAGTSRSDPVREALRRQLAISALDHARAELIPLAGRLGGFTDEDVFDDVS
jgi:predicted transcriptional regulator